MSANRDWFGDCAAIVAEHNPQRTAVFDRDHNLLRIGTLVHCRKGDLQQDGTVQTISGQTVFVVGEDGLGEWWHRDYVSNDFRKRGSRG